MSILYGKFFNFDIGHSFLTSPKRLENSCVLVTVESISKLRDHRSKTREPVSYVREAQKNELLVSKVSESRK